MSQVEFGFNSTIDVNIEEIVNTFVNEVFELTNITDEEIEKIQNEKGVSKEKARQIVKEDKDKTKKEIPDKDGNLESGDTNSSGSLKNVIEMFVKSIYKIVGFFVENFIVFLEPIKELISQLFYNIEKDIINPTILPDIVFLDLSITATTGTPAQGKFIADKVTTLIKQIKQIQSLISEVLSPILKLIGDLPGQIVELITKPLKDLNVPLPDFNMGFANIKIPGFDKKGLLTKEDSPLNQKTLEIMGLTGLNLYNLINNPISELKNLGFDTTDLKDENIDQNIPEISLTEIEKIQELLKDPIYQLKYINAIKSQNKIDDFYREPYDINNGGFQYTFDFFKNFNYIETGDTPSLYNSLQNSKLLDDPKFIKDFFNLLLNNYDLNNIPEIAKEYVNLKNGEYKKLGFTKDVIQNVNDLFDKKLTLSPNKNNFLTVLKKSYELNFWNTMLRNNKPYLYGKYINTKLFIETKFNYKDFKLKFWNIIPKNKLLYFTSYINSYIISYKEELEPVENLTNSFTDVLRISNSRYIGGNPVTGNKGTFYKGILTNNSFRIKVDLPPLGNDDIFTKDDVSGIANYKPSSNADIINKMKDKIPALLTYFLTSADFFKQLIMLPINLLFTFLEKFINILKNALSLNIVGVVDGIIDLIKSITPSSDWFKNIGKSLIEPLLNILKSKNDKTYKDNNVDPDTFTNDFNDKINKIMGKDFPHLLYNTLTKLFEFLKTEIIGTLPIIPDIPIPKWE